MSTEEQEYSIAQQRAIISKYAEKNCLNIVRTYADEGKSGLRLKGRAGLQQLLVDVSMGDPGYEAVLVVDVTRWGRFQDADEAAHYEFICRQAGIAVHYCAEIFNNDGSPQAALLKTMKRAMAAEFSRELAGKVLNGQSLQIKQGYWQGGRAGFGLRRALVDSQMRMRSGERKALRTDKTILVHGPREEIITVRKIFSLCANGQCSPAQIANIMNAEAPGRAWNAQQITRLLRNDKYCGAATRNRTHRSLGTKAVHLPKDQWVTNPSAFKPIVSRGIYEKAQIALERFSTRKTDDRYLDLLDRLRCEHGRLTRLLVDAAVGLPSSSSYVSRFGSMREAYARIGYVPDRSYRHVEEQRNLRRNFHEILRDLVDAIQVHAFNAEGIKDDMVIIVDDRLALTIEPLICIDRPGRRPFWRIYPRSSLAVPNAIFLLMAGDHRSVMHYGYVDARGELTRTISCSGSRSTGPLRVFPTVASLYEHLVKIDQRDTRAC